jgi:hypothetical protein
MCAVHHLLQLNNNNNNDNILILQLDGAPTLLVHIVRECSNMNFPGQWIRRGPITWPSRSPDLTPLDFLFWGYVKAVVYNQRVDMLDEHKAWTAAAIANVTKDMLRHAWKDVNYK